MAVACATARPPAPGVAERARAASSWSGSLRVSVSGKELLGRSRALVAFRRPDAVRIEIPGPSGARLVAVVLEAALQSYLTKFETRYGLHVEFTRPGRLLPSLVAGLEMTVLRIAQESLLNIARLAQADQVTLSLLCEEDGLLLVVDDNGIGIPSWQSSNGRSNGHGLVLMRERAEAVGGTLKISSMPAKGTRIEAYLPFEDTGKSKVEKEGQE